MCSNRNQSARVTIRLKKLKVKKIKKVGLKFINESKIVVPLHRGILTDVARRHLEKVCKNLNRNQNSPFIFVNLQELNRSIQSENPEEPPIKWINIISQHLPKWIIIKAGDRYEILTRSRVNGWINEYFVYMPFVQQRLWSGLNVPFGAGFDKELEAKDYKVNDYAKCRLKEQFKYEVVDKLFEIEIIT